VSSRTRCDSLYSCSRLFVGRALRIESRRYVLRFPFRFSVAISAVINGYPVARCVARRGNFSRTFSAFIRKMTDPNDRLACGITVDDRSRRCCSTFALRSCKLFSYSFSRRPAGLYSLESESRPALLRKPTCWCATGSSRFNETRLRCDTDAAFACTPGTS